MDGMESTERLRVGVVAYTNAYPLTEYLPQTLPRAEIVRVVPSKLGRMMSNGEIDVALLSSIELLRHPEYGYIPGLGICSDGPVRSVCLYTDKDLRGVKSIALDSSSLTSIVLLKILCKEHWNIDPRFETYTPPLRNGLALADAALTIGDFSLIENNPTAYCYDLGEAWKTMTGFPFVYALWITRPGLDAAPLIEPFTRAKELGLQNVETLSETCAASLPVSKEVFVDYFTKKISYTLDEPAVRGMELFFEKARVIGI